MNLLNKKEKVAIYIDGSNFYGYLKDKEINFPKGIKFDFKSFINFLVGSKRKLVSKRYYTGPLRNAFRTVDWGKIKEEISFLKVFLSQKIIKA